jgi:hypothetical protein
LQSYGEQDKFFFGISHLDEYLSEARRINKVSAESSSTTNSQLPHVTQTRKPSINFLNFLDESFRTVQAIASPKKSALVDFNILISFQHLNEDLDENATPESGLSQI